jgi:hypothetical protein
MPSFCSPLGILREYCCLDSRFENRVFFVEVGSLGGASLVVKLQIILVRIMEAVIRPRTVRALIECFALLLKARSDNAGTPPSSFSTQASEGLDRSLLGETGIALLS